jgi:hypothetical protein
MEQLLSATRLGSLSLVGWRIFGSVVRSLLARTGEGEIRLRNGDFKISRPTQGKQHE